jgi:toxin FitB
LSYLLDTCVLSEFSKKSPSAQVLHWLESIPQEELFISVLTLGEIRCGIGKLPDGRKKNDLFRWFDVLREVYEASTLEVDGDIALRWGAERARLTKRGQQGSVIDGLIALTALHHNLYLVTRNVSDFSYFDIELINPWPE